MKTLVKPEIFIRRKFVQYLHAHYRKRDQSRLKKEEFVIISNNCWGGQLYQWLDKPYNSPFIGLMINGPCYVKLLGNFDYYMDQELKFTETTRFPNGKKKKYPIGLLDDVEVHFTHYESEEEAREKWTRRKERMMKVRNKDNYYVAFLERDYVNGELIEAFHEGPFRNKVSFAMNKYGKLGKESIVLHQKCHLRKNTVPNGKKVFKISFLYFDVINWLNTQQIVRTRFN